MDKSLTILELSSEIDELREENRNLKHSLEFQKLVSNVYKSLADSWRTNYYSLNLFNHAKH